VPDWKPEILRRLAPLKLAPMREAEIAEEVAQHLEDRYRELLSMGQTDDSACRTVLDELEGEDFLERGLRPVERESYREPPVPGKRSPNVVENIFRDFHYALRALGKSPGFTMVAVVTLALGIGVNSAVFSIFDWAALRMPAVSKPNQLATLAAQDIGGGWDNGFSYPDLVTVRNQSASAFSDVAGAIIFSQDGLSADGNSTPVWTNYVTGNFFQTMGVKPALGNLIEPRHGKSVDVEPVLVLGYAFWKSRFGGGSNVIGKSVLINGQPVTIIGVAPKGFHGVTSLIETQGYLPLGMAAVTSDAPKGFLADRKAFPLTIVARLKPGVSVASSQPMLKTIGLNLASHYPTTDAWKTLRAIAYGPMSPASDPQDDTVVAIVGALFLTLAGLVLVLACLNVATVLLARASARQHEMAVRAAVGGARHRLIRQLLTESFVLSLGGCAGGIALGLAASRYLGSINLHMAVPLVLDFQFDLRVLAYAFGAAVLTTALVGIAPALRATRGGLSDLLRESVRTETPRTLRSRSALVVAQVAGSLMLLIVAGLFVRSLRNVEHANLGFDPHNVLNFSMDPHQAGYTKVQSWDFLQKVVERMRALPGVGKASFAETVPMGGVHYGANLKIAGYSRPRGQGPYAGYDSVSTQYFETMRIRMLRGRSFLDSDSQTTRRVAIINEAMAKAYWPNEDPIGRRFSMASNPKDPVEIIGEVENSRIEHLTGTIEPFMYLSLAQTYHYREPVTLQLRTSLPLAAMNDEVAYAVHSLASTMPIFDVQTMTTALDTTNGLLFFQIGAALAGCLGLLGLVLATVGSYGVVSYSASQRTREIGIRMALGARQGDVLRLMLLQASLVIGAGIAVGILGAAVVAHLASHFLSGVSTLDPVTYLVASVLLTGIALLACYVPARRATRVDPIVALRYE
jgi:predicted permease